MDGRWPIKFERTVMLHFFVVNICFTDLNIMIGGFECKDISTLLYMLYAALLPLPKIIVMSLHNYGVARVMALQYIMG